MSVKAVMATILQNELALRGVHSLTPSDYEEIVELLIEQLRELEVGLAARALPDKHELYCPFPNLEARGAPHRDSDEQVLLDQRRICDWLSRGDKVLSGAALERQDRHCDWYWLSSRKSPDPPGRVEITDYSSLHLSSGREQVTWHAGLSTRLKRPV